MTRILIVDDEPSICKALEMGLTSNGDEIDVAIDGNAAILMGTQKKYDISIVDLCLPDMDGLEVIKELKRFDPELIPIVITGNAGIESAIEAIRLEVSDYLEKPLSMKSIRNSIRLGLERRALKRKWMRKQTITERRKIEK